MQRKNRKASLANDLLLTPGKVLVIPEAAWVYFCSSTSFMALQATLGTAQSGPSVSSSEAELSGESMLVRGWDLEPSRKHEYLRL